MPDILITENICGEAMDELCQQFDAAFEPDLWQQPGRLLSLVPDFRALIARNQTQLTRELMAAGTGNALWAGRSAARRWASSASDASAAALPPKRVRWAWKSWLTILTLILRVCARSKFGRGSRVLRKCFRRRIASRYTSLKMK